MHVIAYIQKTVAINDKLIQGGVWAFFTVQGGDLEFYIFLHYILPLIEIGSACFHEITTN